jgi:dihydroxyacetone kinase
MAKKAMGSARAAAKRGDDGVGCDAAIEAYEAASAYGSSSAECRSLMREAEKFLESVGRQHSAANVPTQFE